jgi:cysteinyl-tRNA synthetase
LKNFTTIRDALAPLPDGSQPWTARGLRTVFLLGGWKEGVEITEDLVKAEKAWEEKLTNFFLKAVDMRRNILPSPSGVSAASASLQKAFEEAKTKVHEALCDSFNTPAVMTLISTLITEVNSVPQSDLDVTVTLDIAKWLTKIVTIFGLNGNADVKNVDMIGWEGVEIPSAAQPYIYPLAKLRDEVRKQARSNTVSKEGLSKLLAENVEVGDANGDSQKYSTVLSNFKTQVQSSIDQSAPSKDLLGLCDALRDVQLWDLDIYLEDREEQGSMVRPLDASLKQARAEKEKRDQERKEAKERRDKEEAEKKKAKEALAKISQQEMFKTAEYSAWDADGVPTKDKDGVELPKNKKKKLVKDWEKQKKLHEEWLKNQAK